MAFVNETVNTSFNDFITALRSMAITLGFASDNLTPTDQFALRYNGISWNFDPTPSSIIEFKMSRGQNTSNDWENQPDTYQTGFHSELDNLDSSNVRFLLFGDAPSGSQAYIHAVLEVDSGEFIHMHIGRIDKFGTWSGEAGTEGGEYSIGMKAPPGDYNEWHLPWNPATLAQGDAVNIDASLLSATFATGWMVGSPIFGTVNSRPSFNVTAIPNFNGPGLGYWEELYHLGQIPFSGINPMWPILVYARNTGDHFAILSQQFPAGQVRDIRFLNMEGLDPGDTISAGGDTWHVFPVRKKGLTKNATEAGLDTGFAAFAYKEVP